MHLANDVAFCALHTRIGFATQTAGDDDAPIRRQRFANGVQAFFHRIVNESTGVDDDQIGAFKGFGCLVALGAQLGENQLRIGQRFGAA